MRFPLRGPIGRPGSVRHKWAPPPKPPPAPTAFRPVHKPPLELDVEIELPDGDTVRRAADSRFASKRPRGIWFSTQRGDGFGPGGCSFARPIFKDYPDLTPMNAWRFVGRQGDVAHESRLHASPRGNDAGQQVDVSLKGWMTYLAGRRCAPLIVDQRNASWVGPTLEELIRHNGLNRAVSDASASQTDGLGLRWTGPMAGGVDPISPVYFDSGPENRVGDVYYDFTIPKTSAGAETSFTDAKSILKFLLAEDDHFGSGIDGANLRAASASGYLSPSELRRWVYLFWLYENAGTIGLDGEEYSALIRKLAVYGDHGLTRRGSDPASFWLSDIIQYVLGRYFPKIEWAGEDNTTLVSQATWHDNPTEGYQLIQQLNDMALWETNMWENRRFHYHQADLTKYDFVIRTTDPGVKVLLDGPSMEDFANGAEVSFTDFAGRKQVLYPSDHDELRDDDDSNPANRQNEYLWIPVEVPWPCYEAEALQFGRAALAEHNRPKRPGRFQISGGYIRDGAGHWQQGWKVRNSMTLGILDHPDDHPRLITATPRWDQETKTLDVTVDAPPKNIEAIVARQVRAREAANLT